MDAHYCHFQVSHHIDGTHRVGRSKCPACFYTTTSSVHLRRHVEDFHPQRRGSLPQLVPEKVHPEGKFAEVTEENSEVKKCPDCDFKTELR